MPVSDHPNERITFMIPTESFAITSADAAALLAATAGAMEVNDVTPGVPPGGAIRLRGRLLMAPDAAHKLVAERMRPLGRTPVLRAADNGNGQEILALPMTFGQGKTRVWPAVVLFGLTVLSCLFAGAQMVEGATTVNWHLPDGLPFAASLMAILTAHEFGHYLTARRLGSPTSLPYFIPMPVGPFGTLGAFITMSVPPRNRRHLLAVGAAGPLSGLALAVPLLWLGLNLSHLELLPAGGYTALGNSFLLSGLTFLRFGRLLPSGGEDVFLHQVAFAGWAGLLVTALNLIPAGQLDGGHISYALLGRKGARVVTWIVIAALAGLSFLWTGWLLWLALVLLFGRQQDMPLDDLTELTIGQRVFAATMFLVFILVFVPVPMLQVP
jgi:membrane-associated protease RseP (regulator of RpoE activity)